MTKLARTFAPVCVLLALALTAGCHEAKITKRKQAAEHFATVICECATKHADPKAAADCRQAAVDQMADLFDTLDALDLDEETTAEFAALETKIDGCLGGATAQK